MKIVLDFNVEYARAVLQCYLPMKTINSMTDEEILEECLSHCKAYGFNREVAANDGI